MNKKALKTTIEIMVLILIIITIYLGIAYKMRDEGEIWCKMSFGEYRAAEYCNNYNEMGGGQDCWATTFKVCSMGLFNTRGGQGMLRLGQ